jgi:hypothetical protein
MRLFKNRCENYEKAGYGYLTITEHAYSEDDESNYCYWVDHRIFNTKKESIIYLLNKYGF